MWVSHFPVFGGPHNLMLRLADGLAEAGIRSSALLPDEPGSARDRLTAAGLPVVTCDLPRIRRTRDVRVQAGFVARSLGVVDRIRRVLVDHDVDVVIVGGLANPASAIAAHRLGRAVVWQILDTSTPRLAVDAVLPLVRRCADTVMLNGEALRQHHLGGEPLPQSTFVFAGAVDTAQMRPSETLRRQTRARCGVPPEALLVGTVANRNPQKGIEWFIRAAGPIHRRRPDAWFLISGAAYTNHAGYEALLARERAASGVPPERWIVTDEPPRDWYPALDVKCITSIPASEGTTTTALEAMACELPVVATDVGAVREVVLDGVTGTIVPPLDAAAIAAAVIELADRPERRAQMGAAGRRRVRERFDLGACVATHVAAIEQAQAVRRSRAGQATGARA